MAVAALAAASLSGVVDADPRTPPAARGQAAPFLGTAVIGQGGLTAAVDAYGDVADLRLPGPAGRDQIHNTLARQRAGSVPSTTGITVAASAGRGQPRPLWTGSAFRQRYLPGTNVLRTSVAAGAARVTIADAAGTVSLGRRIRVRGPAPVRLRLGLNLDLGGDRGGDEISVRDGALVQTDGRRRARCSTRPAPAGVVAGQGEDARAVLSWEGAGRLTVDLSCSFAGRPAPPPAMIAAADRRWLGRARPLGPGAPGWARRMYARSLLVLRALTDRRTGAVAAGTRDRWAYVWPRDAAAGALALRSAGYRWMAARSARFLRSLPIAAAARFHGSGRPVADGRALAGDARGWIDVAARATGLPTQPSRWRWRDRHDYAESRSGDFLGNAIAAGVPAARLLREFATGGRLVRHAGDPASGLDPAAAWAVVPFRRSGMRAAAATTVRAIAARARRFGIRPGRGLKGADPWTAPTAWAAWALAALGDTPGADRLLGCLRRAATGAGTLPERLSAGGGVPLSTTPLAWSHAFAAVAIRARWPGRD